MKKIINYLNSIAKDRYQHYTFGVGVAGCVFGACSLFIGYWLALVVSVLAVAAVAKIKECYDERNGGRFDWLDFVVTCAGGATIWITAAVMWFVLR